MKIVIVIMLIAVLAALASAGGLMLRKGQRGASGADTPGGGAADPRMARALALRVGLSIALFVFILVAWRMGWIQPSGIPVSA